jgi:hypothetical protein
VATATELIWQDGTALLTRLAAEDPRSLIGAHHKWVAETIARLDGFAGKQIGRRRGVYFDYP